MIDTHKQYPKTIGILGGMGPAATALTFELIIELTDAKSDDEHLPVLLYSLPQIPDRTAAIAGRGPSPVPAIISGLHVLQRAGVDFIIIPCNTAFHFYAEFAPHVDLPIVHIGLPAIQRLHAANLPNKKIGVLSTAGTRQAQIYTKLLGRFGYQPVLPTGAMQAQVMQAIREIKAGNPNVVDPIAQAGDDLLQQGAKCIILACTELSLLYEALQANFPVLDTTRCLAQAAIDIATGQRDVYDFVLPLPAAG